jgi:hypothetical protein
MIEKGDACISQRNFTILRSVLSTVHFSHASLAYLLKNLVMANGLADHAIPLVQCS